MVTPIPGYKSFLGYPEYDGVDEVELVGIDCGSARQTLDPIEMRLVVGNVRIGPVMTIPLTVRGRPSPDQYCSKLR